MFLEMYMLDTLTKKEYSIALDTNFSKGTTLLIEIFADKEYGYGVVSKIMELLNRLTIFLESQLLNRSINSGFFDLVAAYVVIWCQNIEEQGERFLLKIRETDSYLSHLLS